MTDASFTARLARLGEAAPGLLTRALGAGGCYADLFYERSLHHRIVVRQEGTRRVVDPPHAQAGTRCVEGVGLRVLHDGAMGFAATDDLSPEALARTADEAAAQHEFAGAPRRAAALTEQTRHPDLPADAPDGVAASEKAALVRAAVEAAFSLDSRVRCVEATYQDRVRRVGIATSEGALRAEASMLLGLRVSVTLAAHGHTVQAHAVAGGASGFGRFFAQPPEQVAREAVERAARLMGARPLAPGARPVVLAGGWGGVWLHEALGHLLEADTVAAGHSPFAGRLGRSVAAPAVTLVDDATLPGGRGSYAFDDEGAPAGRTALIEDGVLRAFLTDRCTARQMRRPRTGNGRRQDYRHPPLPRMTNLLLLGGDADPSDLLADVADGLYVEAVGHGAARPGGGFAFDVLEGYRIEQGRRTTPVTGVRLVGRGPEVLGNVVGVGRDVEVDAARGQCRKAGQVVPVSIGTPTVLLRAMQVAAGQEAA